MKILILGAGQVGSSVAANLAREANDITLVDKNPDWLHDLRDRMDIQTVVGDASHPNVLEKAGIECTLANDGQEGLDVLQGWVDEGINLQEKIALVISDIEMPRMDGYTFTTKIRQDPRLSSLYVLLHTSLSGVFNNSMVEKVGANKFIPKFKPNELVTAVLDIINKKTADGEVSPNENE